MRRRLQPRRQSGGWVYETFHALVGQGPGAGMSVIVLVTGLLAASVGFGGYAFRTVRDAERLLPDHAAD